jgi:hypothetical protein
VPPLPPPSYHCRASLRRHPPPPRFRPDNLRESLMISLELL